MQGFVAIEFARWWLHLSSLVSLCIDEIAVTNDGCEKGRRSGNPITAGKSFPSRRGIPELHDSDSSRDCVDGMP